MLPPTNPSTNRFHHQLFRQGDGRGERSQGVLRSPVNGREKEVVHLQNVFCFLSHLLSSLYGGHFFLGLILLAFRLLLS